MIQSDGGAFSLNRRCIGPTGSIVSNAAAHTPRPLRVNRCLSIQRPGRLLSVVAPIGDKMVRRGECSDVPLATNAPQQNSNAIRSPHRRGRTVSATARCRAPWRSSRTDGGIAAALRVNAHLLTVTPLRTMAKPEPTQPRLHHFRINDMLTRPPNPCGPLTGDCAQYLIPPAMLTGCSPIFVSFEI
jgi:hypothetical protein